MRTARNDQARRAPRVPVTSTQTLERAYTRETVRLAKRLRLAIGRVGDQLRPDFDALQDRDDAANVIRLDTLREALGKVRRARDRFGRQTVRIGRLRELARNMDRLNRGQVSRVIGQAITLEPDPEILEGQATVRLPSGSRRVASTLDAWVRTNTSLVTNIPVDTWRQVEATVRDGFRKGSRHEVIARRLAERGVVAESRARLIARDQINKLNGQLTEARHRDLGITRYRWQTVGDDRVRDEHEALEGQIFAWDDPPAEGHPGQPIQCRCSPIPIVSDLLEAEA